MATRSPGDTGVYVPVSPPSSQTSDVLIDVVLRRHDQVRKYGHNEDTPDGTGPQCDWAGPVVAVAQSAYAGPLAAPQVEEVLREDYDLHCGAGKPLTWVHLLREEFAEAMCEDDPAKLYDELIDIAAVSVSWAEKIRAR